MSSPCNAFQARIVERLQDASELLALSSVVVRAESSTFTGRQAEEFLNGGDGDATGILIAVLVPVATRQESGRIGLRTSVLVMENKATNTTSPAITAESCAWLVFSLLEKVRPPSNNDGIDLFTPIRAQGAECITVSEGFEFWQVDAETTTGIGILDAVYWVTGAGAPIIATIAEMVSYTTGVTGSGYLLADPDTPEAQGLWFYRDSQPETEDGVDVINCDDGGQFKCLSHFACDISSP